MIQIIDFEKLNNPEKNPHPHLGAIYIYNRLKVMLKWKLDHNLITILNLLKNILFIRYGLARNRKSEMENHIVKQL